MSTQREEFVVPKLYETEEARFRGIYRVFATTIMASILLIWYYRLTQLYYISTSSSSDDDRNQTVRLVAWVGMFISELGFGLYWIITQSVRWSLLRVYPFKQRLSRYESKLPSVDIFVCTADPKMEPPNLVINTVLSLMAYNYPPEKLSVYVSDDGGSELTFYALLEASTFSKHWIPFCKRFGVELRAPEAYFAQHSSIEKNVKFNHEWLKVKKLYEEMKMRIESVVEMGNVPEELKKNHKGFMEWNLNVKKNDHQSIVKIVIDGRDTSFVDDDGLQLPTLVYMAREKRPNWRHNFKAGAMNALIRVSAEISNAPIILNVDCDMYSNSADTIREILCFFLDEKKGHEFAFVQFPQSFDNVTKNDIYGNANHSVNKIELAGMGGYEAALYCGTGCFHRRESLRGENYSKGEITQWNKESKVNEGKSIVDLEESSKVFANCSFEKDTQWGKEMGLMYDCPVEDIVTGLAIQCRGWKSVYYSPERWAFLGVAPTTLEVALIQHKRWSEGMSQIFMSKYCPFIYGHGKLKFGAQMGYSICLLWAPFSLPTLYYVIVPSLCLLKGVSLFPEVSSPLFIPFAYAFVAKNVVSAIEAMVCGSTLKAWWNTQRMWLLRRTSSYFFAFIDIIKRKFGLSETHFALTDKVVTEDVEKRYRQEIIEFGSPNLMFTVLATLALLNLFVLVGATIKLVVEGYDFWVFDKLVTQFLLCGIIVLVNLPVYQALFIRGDKGRLPFSVLFKSFALASAICFVSSV